MKNKSFKICNRESVKPFFLHEQLLDALFMPIIIIDRKDSLIYKKKITDVIGYDVKSIRFNMG